MGKPKAIGFFGGPGAGKSTIAAWLFSALKEGYHDVELVPEKAKECAWLGDPPDQIELQTHQENMLTAIIAQKVIPILDSPPLIAIPYINRSGYSPALQSFLEFKVRRLWDQYDTFNIWVSYPVDKPYNPKGRFQSEEEARKIHNELLAVYQTMPNRYEYVKNEQCAKAVLLAQVLKFIQGSN